MYNRDTVKRFAWVIAVLVVLSCVVYPIVLMTFWYEKPEQRAIFGDMFGGLNALFSGLAFVGVITAIFLQREELQLQREELQSTREELRRSAEAQEDQNQFLAKQAAQNQFFQMLSSWQDVVEEVAVEGDAPFGSTAFERGIWLTGRAALATISGRLRGRLHIPAAATDHESAIERRRKTIESVYDEVVRKSGSSLGHYFRLFYHIIRFVDSCESFSEAEKKDFARILRAHFSEGEFLLLFYNCIHPDGEKLHPLVEKYDLLQNMNLLNVVEKIDLDFYPETSGRSLFAGKLG